MASILTDQTPATGTNVSDSTLYTLGVEWTSSANGSWVGIRVYTPTTQPALPYQVVGYSVTSPSTGTELGRGSATWVAGGVWQNIMFATPVPITAGTHYVAGYVTPDFFVLTNHGYDSAIVNGNLTGFANGDGAALNGRICIGSDGFPNVGSGNAANYFADPLVQFGTVITVGTATETDSALSLGRSKRRAVPIATETDVSIAIPASKRRPVGTANETDAAIVLAASKRRAVGTATETDASIALGRTKRRTLGLSLESDSALSLPGVKRRALGTAAETDLALTIALPTSAAVGPQAPIVSRASGDLFISRTAGGVL